jgi:hypothetical protein
MFLEFKEMIRIINYMCKYATFALQLLLLLLLVLLFKWYVTKYSSRYMLTAQMSRSDSPNYAVPVPETCQFPQPYFLHCLESAAERDAFSHSTQANKKYSWPCARCDGILGVEVLGAGCEQSALRLGRFGRGQRAPGGWHRAGLAHFNMRNSLPLLGIELRFLGSPRHYTEYATAAAIWPNTKVMDCNRLQLSPWTQFPPSIQILVSLSDVWWEKLLRVITSNRNLM